MAPTFVQAWTGTITGQAVWATPSPSNMGIELALSNNPGNWLVAFVEWQQVPATGFDVINTTITVADTNRNYWVPLVTSPFYGSARVSIWAAPNARSVGRVMVAPNGPVRAMVTKIMEFSGMPAWLVLDGSTAEAAYSNAIVRTLTPSQNCLVLNAAGVRTQAVSLVPGGLMTSWTTSGTVLVNNGVDSTGDALLVSQYATTAATAVADWQVNIPPESLVNAVAAIQLTPTVPAAPNANWPLTQFQAGFGAGPGTPRDQVTWTDLTARMVTATGSRGRQYELDQLQAGTGTFHLRNNDGALDPTNTASAYYPNVQIGTPLRLLATRSGITYPIWYGYAERWPQSWDDTNYGWCDVTATDAYAALITTLPSPTRSEKLLDGPYGYWPLSDSAGNTSGANLVSSQQPITQVISKNGAGSATAAFGANTGAISGDGDTGGWSQLGLTSAQNVNGYSLQYYDTGLPSLSGGVTVEVWARAEITQPTAGELVLLSMKDSSGALLQLYLDQTTGFPTIAVWDQYTRARTNVSQATWGDRRNGGYTHYAVTVDQGTWALHVNGNIAGGPTTGTCNLPAAWNLLGACGQADKFFAGRMVNGSWAHLAVYPRKLEFARIISHFGIDGWFTADYTDQRLHRHMSHAPAGIPRVIDYVDTRLGNLPDTTGRTVADCLWDAVDTDNGLLYVDGAGVVQYRSKIYTANLDPKYVLGDNPGEIPMLGGVTFDWDSSQVKNDVTISQQPGLKAGDGVTELKSGVVINSADTASIARFGDITFARTAYFSTGYSFATTDLANWLRYKFAYPSLRTETIEIDPASNPAIWPTALAIEIGDVVTVNRRPIYRTAISRTMQVQQVTHTIGPGSWKVTLELAPADPVQLVVDDATRGQLNGGNVIGY